MGGWFSALSWVSGAGAGPLPDSSRGLSRLLGTGCLGAANSTREPIPGRRVKGVMPAQELERELWLRADPASVSVARAFVAQAAEELHYDRVATDALRLGITEAVANAVEHGAPCEGLISVSVYLEAGCLTTEVGDCGHFQAAWRATDGLDERGRGLPLMFAVMDCVEIDSVPGRTVVRLVKQLPGTVRRGAGRATLDGVRGVARQLDAPRRLTAPARAHGPVLVLRGRGGSAEPKPPAER